MGTGYMFLTVHMTSTTDVQRRSYSVFYTQNELQTASLDRKMTENTNRTEFKPRNPSGQLFFSQVSWPHRPFSILRARATIPNPQDASFSSSIPISKPLFRVKFSLTFQNRLNLVSVQLESPSLTMMTKLLAAENTNKFPNRRRLERSVEPRLMNLHV